MKKRLSGLLHTSMMTPAERRAGRFMRAPDGHPGGDAPAAGDPPAGDPPADPGSILFPDDGKKGEGDDPKPDAPAGDWKEYENDPDKSDEENAAAKAEHDKTKPAAADDKKDDAADKVPEDGKYALTMPEGVELDQALLDDLGPEFKELGLTNSQAQKLADKFIASQQAKAEKAGENWSATITKWADDAKADKEIGGDKWDATVSASQRAVKTLGTPALREYLNASGGGNHPELIRFMAKVGAMIKEDSPAGGGEGGNKPAEPAHLLFPSDAPKG